MFYEEEDSPTARRIFLFVRRFSPPLPCFALSCHAVTGGIHTSYRLQQQTPTEGEYPCRPQASSEWRMDVLCGLSPLRFIPAPGPQEQGADPELLILFTTAGRL